MEAPGDRHESAGSQLPVVRPQSKIGFVQFHPVLPLMAEVADTRVKTAAGPSVAPAVPEIPPILPLLIRSVNDHLDSSRVRLRLGGLHPPYDWHRSGFLDAPNPANVRLVALVLPYTIFSANRRATSGLKHRTTWWSPAPRKARKLLFR